MASTKGLLEGDLQPGAGHRKEDGATSGPDNTGIADMLLS